MSVCSIPLEAIELEDNSASVGFSMPDELLAIPEQDRDSRAWWSADVCVIDNHRFFARASLEFSVLEVNGFLTWEIWVSLSEQSFNEYSGRQDEQQSGGPYWSRLANALPGYPAAADLELQIYPFSCGRRPMIYVTPSDHPLALDFIGGISVERAVALLEMAHFLHERHHAS